MKDRRNTLRRGRNEKGQFVKGNTNNPLPNYLSSIGKLKTRLARGVTEEDMDMIVSRLVAQAKGGDINATKILFNRLFGKPRQDIDLNTSGPNMYIQIVQAMAAQSGKKLDREIISVERS